MEVGNRPGSFLFAFMFFAIFCPSLKALNFDADGADQLKRAFKRFDKNGDGKLSVVGQLGGSENGLAPEECKKLFVALDKDDNGKLTVSDWLVV